MYVVFFFRLPKSKILFERKKIVFMKREILFARKKIVFIKSIILFSKKK
jgi:hypothetical protein